MAAIDDKWCPWLNERCRIDCRLYQETMEGDPICLRAEVLHLHEIAESLRTIVNILTKKENHEE